MGLLVLLVAPVTAFTLHSRRLGTTDIAAPGSDPILSPAATAAATASAPPAATRVSFANEIIFDPRQESSCFSIPAALSGLVDFSEFEHTNSAAFPLR